MNPLYMNTLKELQSVMENFITRKFSVCINSYDTLLFFGVTYYIVDDEKVVMITKGENSLNNVYVDGAEFCEIDNQKYSMYMCYNGRISFVKRISDDGLIKVNNILTKTKVLNLFETLESI